MAIPEPPPAPTHYRVLLSAPEGFDAVELQRVLEDCGLRVLGVEELSERKMELQARKPTEKARALQLEDRKAG
jgi:hypothetical protein